MSSPVALAESVEHRLKKRNSTDSSSDEAQALRTLATLAQAAQDEGSAKLAALIDLLQKVGVGKKSSTRVVVFSERIRTLDWIAAAVRAEFGMSEAQVETFHNSKGDEEQQKIIEAFSMEQAPIRVLVTSDIAAEGVNLHHQCYHLVHFDLPWSLITVEQRNGRIDRYGQETSPQIHYLLYQPSDPEVASDVRVVSRLIEKEHAAHKALGDAGSVMGLYSESAEESAVIAALRERTEKARTEALDLKAPVDEEFDPWKFLGLSGNGASLAKVQSVAVREVPSLFDGADTYLRDALRLVGDLESSNWVEDGPVVSFRAPEDLMRRLEVLPQSYLKQRNLRERIRLSSDKETASQSLKDAINQRAEEGVAGTSWPEIHYLGHQHPVLDWAADKVLYRVGRNEAVALAADVSQPTIMLSGIWSNTMGEPIAVDWLAATIEDGLPVFADLFETLKSAGVTASMINKQWHGDLTDVELLAARVVRALELRLKDQVEDQLVAVNIRLDAAKENLEAWQQNARAIAESETSDVRKRRRIAQIDGMKQRVEAMIADHSPAPHPLIRVFGALLPVQAV